MWDLNLKVRELKLKIEREPRPKRGKVALDLYFRFGNKSHCGL